jgi:subtilisin family serine protease
MNQFPHLQFVGKLEGLPLLRGGGRSERSENNRENRKEHATHLLGSTSQLQSDWTVFLSTRKEFDLPELDKEVIPVFLQINPALLTGQFDFLDYGIEIISEEEDGFIIGASLDNLRTLEEKINGFVNSTRSTGKIADLWDIINGNREKWRPEHILSQTMLKNWHNILDDQMYPVEVSIAFDKPLKKAPDPLKRAYLKKQKEYLKVKEQRDEDMMKRQAHFEKFINIYGSLESSYIEIEDSFACEIIISGKGLKDLVFNYPYVFEVKERTKIAAFDGYNIPSDEPDFEIIRPDNDDPEVAIIDSGIMENNKYVELAVNPNESQNYVSNENTNADLVRGGGHGTRVAGGVLYPEGVFQVASPYKLPCKIKNIRILNSNNELDSHYLPELMVDIFNNNYENKIFNLSVTNIGPELNKHMSPWAAIIDKLIHHENILFILASGNVHRDIISSLLTSGLNYPTYLNEVDCKIANPATSCFAITVGSVNHDFFEDDNWVSLGGKNEVSAFSRSGPGIWNIIKPDVVEYGGGQLVSKDGNYRINENERTSPELVRSTLHGGNAIGRDSVGTSYAAPKVSHLAAQLLKLYPNENINLIRALIVQGARLPEPFFLQPTTLAIQLYGYGIPTLSRVTDNSDYRVTFYTTGLICADHAHIYSVNIPEIIFNPGNEFDILIEVTLAFTAKIRRTRQKTKSYLGTWLDWMSASLDDDLESFQARCLKTNDELEEEGNGFKGQEIPWKIKERGNWGEVREFSRNNNTIQKDWAIIKSFNLNRIISFAIRGHKGWDKNNEPIPYAFTVSIEAINQDIQVYAPIKIENQAEVEIRLPEIVSS